jgi:tripartite-type tricarboxylate transporter receptor subunit TctC
VLGDWVGAPKNTPADIIETLNKEVNAGLADPKIKARLATEKWGKVVKFVAGKLE